MRCRCGKFTSMVGVWVTLGNTLHSEELCEPLDEEHRLYQKDHV